MRIPESFHSQPPPIDSQIRNAMISAGVAPPKTIVLDGQIHRDDSFWYIFFGDNIPAGRFGDWKTGADESWVANIGRTLSPFESLANNARMVEAKKRHEEEKIKRNQDASEAVALIWDRLQPASPEHPYLKRKDVDPHGVRIMTDGRLAVPLFNADGTLSSLQYIDASGEKRYHPGAAVKGSFFEFGEVGKKVFLCEGFATGATIFQETKTHTVCAFSANKLPEIAKIIREKYGAIHLVIVADNDRSGVGLSYANQAIAAHGGDVITPESINPQDTDANDFKRSGGDLSTLLNPSPNIFKKLNLISGDDLGDEFEAPDEIVENFLVAKSLAVLYGNSNSGKTFLALAIASAVSEGVTFFDRQTDPGLVVYLATESPESIRSRMQAIKRESGFKLSDLYMVPNPMNFYSKDQDCYDVTQLCRELEESTGKRVRLIIGDTLARMSSGANENSGDDMGPVMDRFTKISADTGACVLIIHHCGKDQAKGARGWSGILAHVDTEIEVVEQDGFRCFTITKQRVLSSKNEKTWFDLKVVPMGISKFSKEITTCVVIKETRETPKTKEKTNIIDEKIHDLKEMWVFSGREYDEKGKPFVTFSAAKNYLITKKEMKETTVNQCFKPSDKGYFFKKLIENSTIEIVENGFIFIDNVLILTMEKTR